MLMYTMLPTNCGVCSTDRAGFTILNNSGPIDIAGSTDHVTVCCYDTSSGRALAYTKFIMLDMDAAKKLATAYYCGV